MSQLYVMYSQAGSPKSINDLPCMTTHAVTAILSQQKNQQKSQFMIIRQSAGGKQVLFRRSIGS